MNFDDYETLWRDQGSPALPSPSDAQGAAALFERVRDDALRLDRALFWRDTREIGAAFAVAALFAASAWRNTGSDYVAWGRWIAVAITLGVAIVFLVGRRKTQAPPSAGLPLLTQIDAALSALRGQARVLKHVPRDYALPLFVATLCAGFDPLIQSGGFAAVWSKAGGLVFGVALAVGGFVVWLNRLAVRRFMEPKIAELEQVRRELDGAVA